MEHKTYSLIELQGVAAILSDMLKQSLVFLQQAEDMKHVHPWLAPTITTLENNPFYYVEMVEHGGGKAEFESENGILRITLPEGITDPRRGRWGNYVPLQFYFSSTSSGEYVFVESLSNEECMSRCR